MKIVVLDGYTLNPGDMDWAELEKQGELTIYDRTPAELIVERAREADTVLTNKAPLSAAMIEQLPNLKYIGVLATGYDMVDVQAATKRQIPVCNVPGYSTDSVAQLTWSLILGLVNQVSERSQDAKQGGWANSQDFSYGYQGIFDLRGKTLSLIGLGDIGSQVAAIGRAFGMRVVAAVRNPDKYHINGVEVTTDIEYCFREADVISLHCPLTSENNQFVNANLLSTMKPDAYLINTARGGLINEADLAAALNSGQIAGAGLDVLSSEPPADANPLLSARSCLVTPHIGWSSREARHRLMAETVSNIVGFKKGATRNQVN